MDPHHLIDPTAQGVPAPLWFVELFKILGFTLHLAPMNLWLAGVALAMVLRPWGSEFPRRFAGRLMLQMPVILAYGINFGIVPLLFVQLAYGKVFYPATILMAWFWFAVILVLVPAYYGVYLYAFALRGGQSIPAWRKAVGWASALGFLAISFLFSNAMSLLTNLGAWTDLWQRHSLAGAATGTALNLGDPTLVPRWLMVFGLALMTTAAWVVFDAGWLARGENAEYRRWTPGFARNLYLVGLAWFAAMGSWYVFGTWGEDVRRTMFHGLPALLTAATALVPGLPLLLILALRVKRIEPTPAWATAVGLAQIGVLAVNAVSRQVVQNLELGHYGFNVLDQPTAIQWSPLVAFLAVFALGAAIVVWMVAQLRSAVDSSSG